jgi:hypothetical protein
MDGCNVIAGRGSGDIGSDGVATCWRDWRRGGRVGDDDVVAGKNAFD